MRHSILRDHRKTINKFSGKNVYFFHFRLLSENFWFLSKDFPQDCQNWLLRVHRNPWKKNNFLKKLLVFLSFWEISEKNSAFWQKKWQVCENCFRRVYGIILSSFFDNKIRYSLPFSHTEQTFSAFSRLFFSRVVRKNYLIFFNSGHWAKKFGPFVEKSSKAANTAFNMFTGTVSKNCLEKKLEFLLFSRTLSEKSSAVYQSLSDEVVKCVFYVSIGKLRRKIFSGKIVKSSFFLGTLTRKNSVCRHAFFGRFEKSEFYVSIGIFWWERFRKELFSVNFGQRAKLFRLQKQHSTGPEEHYNEDVFWK